MSGLTKLRAWLGRSVAVTYLRHRRRATTRETPLPDCDTGSARGTPARASRVHRREHGLALLVVLSTLTLLGAVVADFQFNSRVDLQLALNARDGLQAEYNALSALRLRALLLKHGQRLNAGVTELARAAGLDGAAVPPVGQILEMIPVDCGLISAIAQEAPGGFASRAADDEGVETSALMAGDCLAVSQSEHTKISINVLAKRTGGADQQVTRLLLGLLSNPALERHFQEDDRTGSHAESPTELVAAIADWIDRDKNETGNQVSDEDRYYQYLKDSYRAKNAPFDSVEELQLVHGVDDELFDILKEHVTVHNDGTQIELATAPLERIEWGLWACLRQGVSLLELVNNPGYGRVLQTIAEMRQFGGAAFALLKVATLGELVRQMGLEGVIDPAGLAQVFSDRSASTWHTIEAEGHVGNATRRIRAVFQTSEAQFYHVRVD